MKRYGTLHWQDPRAAEFAGKVRDLGEFLAVVGQRASYRPLPMRLAFHDACHLAHAQGVRKQPRSVLSAVPGLELLETRGARAVLRVGRPLQPARTRAGGRARAP